ncbi:hypothetical protein [Microcoleus sp. B4-C1]|uniref:hypothetical protein n=1 Tax=Microcoleus sp. B4-C1 TaxID=2818660 RepID=UPI002FD2E8FB
MTSTRGKLPFIGNRSAAIEIKDRLAEKGRSLLFSWKGRSLFFMARSIALFDIERAIAV